MLYYQIGIPEGMDTAKWPPKFLRWLRESDLEQVNKTMTLKIMIAQYEFVEHQLKSLSTTIRAIRAYCRKHHKKERQQNNVGE